MSLQRSSLGKRACLGPRQLSRMAVTFQISHSPLLVRTQAYATPLPHRRRVSTSKYSHVQAPITAPPLLSAAFWKSSVTWRRTAINTFRCLIGCTLGDFSMMWFLQSNFAGLGIGVTMSLSMVAGITSSIILETILLHRGRDQLTLNDAARTATGMSLISMLSMGASENAVDYWLTGGVVALESTEFWLAAGAALFAGFLVPLPYNFVRLRKYQKSCH